MSLALSSKRPGESELNPSQIQLNLDGQINILRTESEDISSLLNELKIIGSNHVPKGPQLIKFDSILTKISELIVKQQEPKDSPNKKIESSQLKKIIDQNGWQKKIPKSSSNQFQNIRDTFQKDIPQLKPKKPFIRQGIQPKGKLPFSLKKRNPTLQNVQQIIQIQPFFKESAKYTKFVPTLRAKSPQVPSITRLHTKQDNS